LEEGEGGKVMRWDVNYAGKQHRACVKELKPGIVSGMTTMSFRLRAESRIRLWLQVNEKSGERFYTIITADSGWKKLSLRLEDFELNKDKVVDGRLNVDQITKILVLDVSSVGSKANGKRTLWFSDWEFTTQGGNLVPREDMRASLGDAPVPTKKLSTGKVGMTAVPRDFRETDQRWLDFFTTADEAGVQVLSLQAGFWGKREAAPGVYKWDSWDKFFAVLDKHGFRFECSKDLAGPFFRDKVDVPRDIRFKSFTDPVLLDRYERMATAYLDRYAERLAYIVIHAEGADAYFKRYPQQLDDYCRFLTHVRSAIKRRSPRIQVGVNTDVSNQDHVLSRMAEVTDFLAYDVLKGKVVRSPSDFEGLVRRLIRVSGGKKIAIQNGGWSTSRTDESSDEEQVEFIREFYRVLYRYRDKIEYASFGSLYDHDPSITGPAYRAAFPDYPAAFVDKIIDSMSHFGLFRTDGTPKPGWGEFRKQVAAYYERH